MDTINFKHARFQDFQHASKLISERRWNDAGAFLRQLPENERNEMLIFLFGLGFNRPELRDFVELVLDGRYSPEQDWGTLRSAAHSRDWITVATILNRTPEPVRSRMHQYASDCMLQEEAQMHLVELLGRTMQRVYAADFPKRRVIEQFGGCSSDGTDHSWNESPSLLFEPNVNEFHALTAARYDDAYNPGNRWELDICGELEDLVGVPLLKAQVTTSTWMDSEGHSLSNLPEDAREWGDFWQILFYHFATSKGYVTVSFHDHADSRFYRYGGELYSFYGDPCPGYQDDVWDI